MAARCCITALVTAPACFWASWRAGMRAERLAGYLAMMRPSSARFSGVNSKRSSPGECENLAPSAMPIPSLGSPVDLAQDDVDAPDGGYHVPHEGAPGELRQGEEVREARGPDLHIVGLGAAVADDVVAQLPARGLDGLVHLPGRDVVALGEDL